MKPSSRVKSTDKADTPPTGISPLKKWLLIGVGALALLLGIIGALLPVMPTVPFLLVAAACWSKGSPRLHAWLLGLRYFGPMIQRWERDRALPPRIKALIVAVIAASIVIPIWITRDHAWLTWTLLGAAAIAIIVVLRIPGAPSSPRRGREIDAAGKGKPRSGRGSHGTEEH